jgi:Asp/Glu/hydantoin racemase
VTAQIHKRLDLAVNQLETAVQLFLFGSERFSVITLAGAADAILSQLVENNGKKTFIERLVEDANDKKLDRSAMGKHVNDLLFINALKHMDEDDDGSVVMDVEQCALASILKAMANLVTLRGRGTDFVEVFLSWVKLNLDPAIYNIDCDPDWKPPPAAP